MTDPNNALVSFQDAYKRRLIALQRSRFNRDIFEHADDALGVPRITHARFASGIPIGIVIYCPVQPVGGIPCFAIGYAVDEKSRGQGIGTQLVKDSIEVVRQGFQSAGINDFYLEAIIGAQNGASNQIARKLISASPKSITEKHSNEPAYQYMCRIRK
jgi:GNAT superfamily N-acetyltransferase